ncbi:MAG: MFS transporter [Actinomycetota bacterium]|nr:MFS transporter [Actinomycetota bacterium]
MRRYRQVIGHNRLGAILALYLGARLPAATVWLAALLHVSDTLGSYAVAGFAMASYGVAVAVAAPLLGRLVDRWGPLRVLPACAVVHGGALLVLSGLDAGAPRPLVLLVSACAGLGQPPLTACMRARWALLLVDEEQREVGYSLDSVLGETIDLAAPLLLAALAFLAGPPVALATVATATTLTTVVFAVALTRRMHGLAPAAAQRAHVLRDPRIRLLLAVILISTGALGAIEIAVVAAADRAGSAAAVGLVLALFTAGSLVGGLVHGARSWRWSPASQLVLLCGLLALGLAAASLTRSLWQLAAVLVVTGATVAPTIAVLLSLMGAAAPEGAQTETFTWAATANFCGVAGGSALAGLATESWLLAGLLVGAGLAVVAALLARAGLATLRGDGAMALPHPRTDGGSVASEWSDPAVR